jgi:cytochrome c-type biogenesis protein CcmH
MSGFLIGAALMLAATLFLLLRPLLGKGAGPQASGRAELNLAVLREQMRELDADHAAGRIDAASRALAREELQRRVLEEVLPAQAAPLAAGESRWAAIAVGVALPVLAALLYVMLGTPMALVSADGRNAGVASQEVEAMVSGLASRLKAQPDNPEGWRMLARSYNVLGRYRDAAAAYAQLTRLLPADAGVLADQADTLAMAQQQSLQGEPEKLIERALAIDPSNLKALALAGSAAFERGDYGRAVSAWERLVALAPSDSDIARSTADSIREARRLQSETGAAAARPAAPAAAARRVGGRVAIDPQLRAQLKDEDTVFIFARAAEGSRMPLAALRKQVKDLPLDFVLDEGMAVAPGASLPTADVIVVGARISRSGSVDEADALGSTVSAPLKPGSDKPTLLIRPR